MKKVAKNIPIGGNQIGHKHFDRSTVLSMVDIFIIFWSHELQLKVGEIAIIMK